MVQCPSFAAVTRSRGQNSRSRPLRKMDILARMVSSMIMRSSVEPRPHDDTHWAKLRPPHSGVDFAMAMVDDSDCPDRSHPAIVGRVGAAFGVSRVLG